MKGIGSTSAVAGALLKACYRHAHLEHLLRISLEGFKALHNCWQPQRLGLHANT
jgi:hypothetical protein